MCLRPLWFNVFFSVFAGKQSKTKTLKTAEICRSDDLRSHRRSVGGDRCLKIYVATERSGYSDQVWGYGRDDGPSSPGKPLVLTECSPSTWFWKDSKYGATKAIDGPSFGSVDGNRMMEKIAAEKELKYGPTEESTVRRWGRRLETRFAHKFSLFRFPFIFRSLIINRTKNLVLGG